MLHEAAARNDVEEVKQRLAAGEAIEEKNEIGATPLMMVAMANADLAAAALIGAGAALDTRNDNGDTALSLAAQINGGYVIDVRAGASLNETNKMGADFQSKVQGMNALHLAAMGYG